MPAGLQASLSGVVEGGWGTHRRPRRIWRAGPALHPRDRRCIEALGTANMGFSLCIDADPRRDRGADGHHGTDEQQPDVAAQARHRRMDRHDEPDRAAGGQRRRRAAHHAPSRSATAACRALKIKGRRSSSPSASMTSPTISSTSSSPARPARRRARSGISLFLVPKYRLMPTAADVANDVRCVSIEHKLGIHASPTCVMTYGDEGDCHRLADRRGNGRHARDVHDDEQCAAQCRLQGVADRRAGDAAGGALCRASASRAAAGSAGRSRYDRPIIPTCGACCCG